MSKDFKKWLKKTIAEDKYHLLKSDNETPEEYEQQRKKCQKELEEENKKVHNDQFCPVYTMKVLPDENGNCSLCHSPITGDTNQLQKDIEDLLTKIGFEATDEYEEVCITNSGFRTIGKLWV